MTEKESLSWKFKKEIINGKFEVDLEKLKTKQLEILKVFIECCEKLNLRYFLAFGTLIGAVRHEGFIPWDDDIDLYMPREDYDIFIEKYYDYVPKNYFMQTMESDPLYALNFGKFRDSNTTLIEKHVLNVDINHGVFIDVFPLDGYIKGYNKVLDLRVKENPLFEEPDKNLIVNKLNSINKKLVYRIGEVIPNKLKSDISKKAIPKDTPTYDECDYVASLADGFSIIPLKKSLFGNGVKLKFENMYVKVPENYHEYLTILYGDYMKLPPKDQREPHHNFHFVDTEKGFREYGSYRTVKKWISYKENSQKK